MKANVSASTVETARLTMSLLASGPPDGVPVVLIHGNVSTGRFFAHLMAQLPPRYRVLAPDMRGYGRSEPKPIDATRGLRDLSDDLRSLLESLDLAGRPVHLLGWSVGGAVVMQYAMDHPGHVASLVLEAPMSPVGFGGTRGPAGDPIWPDFAGSGGGTAAPDFVRRLAEGDRSAEHQVSPRNVLNAFYFKPPFRAPHEEQLLDEMLTTRVGDDHYPGDMTQSKHWPGVAPGTRGINNAIAPKYCDLRGFAGLAPQPPVLWVRGADDQIVSDTSFFDFGFLGSLGAIPGWPGADACPPQPMVAQVRHLLDAYRARGGDYREEVLPDCGHSPHIEQPATFRDLLVSFLDAHS